VLLVVGLHGVALSTTEEIVVFLLGEVDVVVTMGMGVFCGIVPVVLPEGVGSKIGGLTVVPGLQLQIVH